VRRVSVVCSAPFLAAIRHMAGLVLNFADQVAW
jgi:hypothetical protein